MYPWSHASSEATTYTARTSIRTSPTAAKSTPCPGTRLSVLAIRSACRTSPCARRASAACSCVVPSGMLRPRTPAKIRSVARPRIRGPIDISATLTTASSRTRTTLNRCGLSWWTSRFAEGPNALAFWPTMPPPIGPRPGPAPWVIRSVSLSWPGLSADLVSLMPPPRAQLGRDDLLVRRGVGEQLLVRAAVDDDAVLEHEDHVGVADRGDALGDDQHRRLPGHRPERRPEPRVGGEVEGGERVVEEVDLRALHHRASDGETLPLTATDVGAALGDGRVEPLGHLSDEVGGLRDLQRSPHLLVGGVRLAVHQVGADGAGEQVRALRDQADHRPEPLGGE